MKDSLGYFTIVLHGHLPFVLHHGTWPHGSDWLCEAALHCYLPLIQALARISQQGIPAGLTLQLSPVLCEQLAHADFRTEFRNYLERRLLSCRETGAYLRRTNRDEEADVAGFWEDFYQKVASTWDEIEGDILKAFSRFTAGKGLEIITSAATHGYLPLLGRDESIELQVEQAVSCHETHFGSRPRGIWLPECGYRPQGFRAPPRGLSKAVKGYIRPGIEEILEKNGLEFFFTDSHMVMGGTPIPSYRSFFPQLSRLADVGSHSLIQKRQASPYRPYRVTSQEGRRGVAVFSRDPHSTLLVWSRDVGYPGDEWYLEFHKKHFPGGLQLWRISREKQDLGKKEVYIPQRARERVAEHARHFVGMVADTLKEYRATFGENGVLCAIYDAELFGHWWFEGPYWLEEVFRLLPEEGVEASGCGDYLEKQPPRETVNLGEGSWGEGGDHRTWLNRDTEWTWEKIYAAEEIFWGWVQSASSRNSPELTRVISQAARELLLMQASDWQFLITTMFSRDYGERRFLEHHADFHSLGQIIVRLLEGGRVSEEDWAFVERKEKQDFLFRDIRLPKGATANIQVAEIF